MFHSKVAAGGGVDDRVKSIQTRSRHRLIFTEDESIILTDKSGNEIHLDTSGGNINITAPNTMTLNAKTLNINVAENMTTNVGMNATETIGMNKTTSIGMMNILSIGADFMTNVLGKMVEFIQGDYEGHSEKGMQLGGQKMEVNSEANIKMNASEKLRRNSGETTNDL